MSSLPASIMETIFNVAYLITLWTLIALMAKNRSRVAPAEATLAGRFLLAFVLLAVGDTFHVGARVVTALFGPAAAMVTVGGVPSSLLGLGMLATAYTMTIFYMVFAEARALRAGRRLDAAFWTMEILLALRLILMALPGNGWELPVPPYVMGLVRNLPLAAAGFMMAGLFIAEGRRDGDRAWAGIGWAMIVSYGFYAPVILFAAAMPMLGLLMIPKTLAYVAMGLIAYKRYWKAGAKAERARAAA